MSANNNEICCACPAACSGSPQTVATHLVDGVETAAHRLKSSFDNEKIHFGSNAARSTMWEKTNMSFKNMLERCCLELSWTITWTTTSGSVSSAQSSTSCVEQLCAAMLRLQASGHAHVCRNSKNKTDALDKYSFLTFLTVTVPCSILPSCRQAHCSQSAPQPLTGMVDG